MCLLAPLSCTPIPGSAPPALSFHRIHYTWLALSLASSGDGDTPASFLENFYYGTHTLTWPAMHAIISRAIASGFNVPGATDIVHAVKIALDWGANHRSFLRVLLPNDFEPLPAPGNRAAVNVVPSWWKTTAFSSWANDGAFQPLCHAMGYAGLFWDLPSRSLHSRFHLSLSLTQEYLPVSSCVPEHLHRDPAIRFYSITMLPHRFLRFPHFVWFAQLARHPLGLLPW